MEQQVDVIKDVDTGNPASETRDLNISEGQDGCSIKEGEELPPETRKIEVDSAENQSLKEDDTVTEMEPGSDLGVRDDSEANSQNNVILLNSQELHEEEATSGSIPMDGEHNKTEEEHTTHDSEHQVESEGDKLAKSDASEDSQVLHAESTEANAEADNAPTLVGTSDSHDIECLHTNTQQERYHSEECVEQNSNLEADSKISSDIEQTNVDGNFLQTDVLSDLPVDQCPEVMVDKEDVMAESESSLGQKEKVVSGYFSSRVANALTNDSITESSIELSMPVIDIHQETLSPFTEEQLKTFYFNQELSEVPVFIDQFLQVS